MEAVSIVRPSVVLRCARFGADGLGHCSRRAQRCSFVTCIEFCDYVVDFAGKAGNTCGTCYTPSDLISSDLIPASERI